MAQTNLIERRSEVIQKYGAWTAHNIHLGGGVYTFEKHAPGFDSSIDLCTGMLRRMLQIATDTIDRPLNQLRVLDLGCLEGIYGIEFALHGSEVIGLDAREANVRKAMFATEALGLGKQATFVKDDVRNLGPAKYGTFDVVLCVGILYHLDAPDVFDVIERIFKVCKRLLIIDTHVALKPNRSVKHRGIVYEGWSFTEFAPNTPAEIKLGSLWSSVDNEQSFWFSRPSLFNLLANVGFASVYDCQMPAFPYHGRDRDTLVAIKGRGQQVMFSPKSRGVPAARWTEASKDWAHPSQEKYLEPIGQSLSRNSQDS